MLPVSATAPEPERIARAAAVLRAGGLVAFPTETVYGLGANALDAEAVAGIFRAKGRPATNPLIVHVAAKEQVGQVAADWPESAKQLADRFWPGPLTLVLPKRPQVPDIVTAGGPTVAVRVPAHPIALALLRAAGIPIAAPSANRSEQLSPTRAEHVLSGLKGRVGLILDGGPTPGGLESTVLDLTRTRPRLLRPGLIGPAQLEQLIGAVDLASEAHAAEAVALPSPGMLRRHYSPRTPLECVAGDGRPRVEHWQRQGLRVAWLTYGERQVLSGAVMVAFPRDAAAYANRLYAVLHDLDQAGVQRIIVELPPEAPEWLAVRDRLLRAAAED